MLAPFLTTNLQLSQRAHINNEILSGPYRGLSQHESAIEVTTVINEQFNSLENLRSQGVLPKNDSIVPRVNEDLKSREMDTPGVMDAVYEGWKNFGEARDCYNEIVSSNSLYHRRSDFTDENSMRLYCSFYGEDAILSELDVAYMTGGRVNVEKKKPQSYEEEKPTKVSSFMRKAEMLGIEIQQSTSPNKDPPALFHHDEVRKITPGFEQINENLFARKDNRFMVFNRIDIDSWPPKSKTKIGGIEQDMDLLQSLIT